MRKTLFILLTFFAIVSATAQNAVMNVRTRTTVAAGQTFQITYDVNARAQNFRTPALKGLTLVGGPNTGYSSSMSIVNGQMTQSVSNTFTILVQADAEGTATVGTASCTVDGKTVSSKPFTIKVEKADPNAANTRQQNQGGWGWGQPSRPSRQPQQQQQQQAAQPTKNIDNNTLFARASINKNNLYQGEEAIIVYKIYTQVPLTQFQIDKLPRNKGFWSEDLSENMTQVRQYTETYNGRQYQVAEIRRGALYPQETGTLNIAPLKTDVVAIIQTQMQRQRTGTIFDFFIDDPFFTPTQQQAVVRSLTSNSINVNVKPLPEAPENFAGGVGHFDIKAKTDLKELHANEAFTYSVTVSGRGNLSLIEAPVVNFPKSMQVYEPRVVDNINKGDNGLSGSRTFEWIVTPLTQGEYDIPEFDYTYFDPSTGQYVSKKCNKIHVKILKPLHGSAAKSDVKELNSDIHHIQKTTRLHSSDNDGGNNPLFWLLLASLAGITIGIILIFRHKQDIAADEASMKLQRATKLARKRLRNAERYLAGGNDNRFYEEIYKALWGCISDKFNIQQSLLSSDTIRRHLEEKQVDQTLQHNILQTLADVDFARFAPGDSSAIKQTIYDKAMNTITQIASINIKRKKNAGTAHGAGAVLLALLLFPALAGATTDPDQLFLQANAAYDSGDYHGAIELYNSILEQGLESWELYYNLGDAYYRADEIGQSILNYERALQLAPGKQIIKNNLNLARSKTTDNIEQLPQSFLKSWTLAVVHLTTPHGWRVIVICLVSLLCAALCTFFVARNYTLRKTMFVISSLLTLLIIISSVNTAISANLVTNSKEAIVTDPMIVVKGSPDHKSVDKFVLHEGTKLTITDEQDQWWQITIADGKNGWIQTGAEKI